MYKSEKPNEVIPREPCYRKSDGRMNKAEFIRSPAEPRFQREKNKVLIICRKYECHYYDRNNKKQTTD